MDKQIANRNSATVHSLSLPKLSESLKRATAEPFRFATDPSDGETYQAQAWQPPADLSEHSRREARQLVPQFERGLQRASDGMIYEWLTRLRAVSAPPCAAAEATATAKAYARDLNHPPMCFTDDTRRDALREFPRFFPSLGELVLFLDRIAAPHRERLRKLKRIAEHTHAAAPKIRRWDELSPEEQAAHNARMAGWRQRMIDDAPARFEPKLPDATIKDPALLKQAIDNLKTPEERAAERAAL